MDRNKKILFYFSILCSANLLFGAESSSELPRARCSLKRVLIASLVGISHALGALNPFVKKELENLDTSFDVCQPYKFPSHYIEHLTPPPLVTTDAAEYHCDRPKRTEGINISLEQRDGKTIVHCYGHGGSGYVTLFGSVEKAVNLLLASSPVHDAPIRIVGSGCMGLAMAAELHRLGFFNIKIVAKEQYDIPSWRAGGFFDPGTGLESTPREQEQLKLSLDTFQTYRLIEQGRHLYLSKDVVKRLPLYSGSHVAPDVEVLESLGYMQPREYVTLDFGNGVRHKDYRKFYTYFIDVTQTMKQLRNEIDRAGIPIESGEIASLTEFDESIIINCAGFGAGKLNADAAVYPSRGHFMMLPKTDAAPDYMLFTKVQQGGKQETVYYFPKGQMVSSANKEGKPHSGMLGGTFVPHIDKLDKQAQKELDVIEHRKLVERANRFFHGPEEARTNSSPAVQKVRTKSELRSELKEIIAQKNETRKAS